MRLAPLLALLLAAPAPADEPGDFDHYVLALSWSPTWCLIEGEADGSPQCGERLGWMLHGLWPQHDDGGWPSWCDAGFPDPSRAETRAMADLMGSDGLAWHAWRKHGTCSGLSPADYFALSREARAAVAVPPGFLSPARPLTLSAALVEEAFARMNPGLDADALVVTCEAGMIEEVRLCMTRELEWRPCGGDPRDCGLRDAVLPPVE